jgi:hypothetical protein
MVGVEPFEEGVVPELPDNWRRFFAALADGKDCAIVEVRYLTELGRRNLVEEVRRLHPDTSFNWVCFENDPVTANANCINDLERSKQMSEGNVALNEQWTQLYEIPKGAIVLKIFPIPAPSPLKLFFAAICFRLTNLFALLQTTAKP